MLQKIAPALLLVAVTQYTSTALADDIQDSIKEGLEHYNNGDLSEASASLTYATQLIQQKKSEGIKDLLPPAPLGWKIEEDSSQASGMSMFGGGITAERRYSKGNSWVNVSLITDSPVLQSVMMMFSNPMFAASDGGKLEKIAGQKTIVNFKSGDSGGEIKLVVDNRMLITVEGSEVTKEELKRFVEAFDFEGKRP